MQKILNILDISLGSKCTKTYYEYMIAIILHIYYTDLWYYFKNKLDKLNTEFDLYVTLCNEQPDISNIILNSFPNAKISKHPNIGQDIGPFLKTLKSIRTKDYDFLIKLHTKKCWKQNGSQRCRDVLVNPLISSDEVIKKNIQIIRETKYKMCGASNWLMKEMWEYEGKMYDVEFVGGTMFMVDFKIMLQILSDEIIDTWYAKLPTGYKRDKSFTHLIERLLGQKIIDEGYMIKAI